MPLIFIFPSVCVYISAPDVYAVIRCEEDSVRTKIFKNNGSPEFNTKAIFYNRNPKSKISIEVRGYCTVFCEGWLLEMFLFYKWINKKKSCADVCIFICICVCAAVEKRFAVGHITGRSTNSDRRTWALSKQSDQFAGWPIARQCFHRDFLQPVPDRPVT